MFRRRYMLVAVLSIAALAGGIQALLSCSRGRVGVIDDMPLDLGVVATDAKIQSGFNVMNSSKSVAEVMIKKASCNCVMPEKTVVRLQPGESTYLEYWGQSPILACFFWVSSGSVVICFDLLG